MQRTHNKSMYKPKFLTIFIQALNDKLINMLPVIPEGSGRAGFSTLKDTVELQTCTPTQVGVNIFIHVSCCKNDVIYFWLCHIVVKHLLVIHITHQNTFARAMIVDAILMDFHKITMMICLNSWLLFNYCWNLFGCKLMLGSGLALCGWLDLFYFIFYIV